MRVLFLLSTACAVLASCGFGAEARIEVLLPPLPEHWRAAFPDMRCLLVCPDGSGQARQVLLPGWESGALIACDKAGNTPIVAWPVSSRDLGACPAGTLRPAGGVYPGSLEQRPGGGVVQLTWEEGAAAAVLLGLRSAGRDTSLFNAPRLCREMREAGDPWDLDLAAIAEAIGGGRFSVYDIREVPRRDLTLGNLQGQWVLESPFRGLVASAADGTVELKGMTLGGHCLYCADGRAVRMEVGEKETVILRAR